MKMNNIFQSLSLKLTAVFMLTAFAYLFLLTIGVRQIILNDEVRETLDYYQSSYLENVFSMRGKVCLVTGASRGIGCSLADAFHNAGAVVFGIGRSENANDDVAWTYRQCDVNNKEQLIHGTAVSCKSVVQEPWP